MLSSHHTCEQTGSDMNATWTLVYCSRRNGLTSGLSSLSSEMRTLFLFCPLVLCENTSERLAETQTLSLCWIHFLGFSFFFFIWHFGVTQKWVFLKKENKQNKSKHKLIKWVDCFPFWSYVHTALGKQPTAFNKVNVKVHICAFRDSNSHVHMVSAHRIRVES